MGSSSNSVLLYAKFLFCLLKPVKGMHTCTYVHTKWADHHFIVDICHSFVVVVFVVVVFVEWLVFIFKEQIPRPSC